MSDPRTVKKNLLQDLMQRARSSTNTGSGRAKFLSGNRSSVKPKSSPKPKTRHSSGRKLLFPSVFRSHKETTRSLETEAKTGSLKENAKRSGLGKTKKQSQQQEPGNFSLLRLQSPVLQSNFDFKSDDKRDKALTEKVLQAIVEKHTPRKEKVTPAQKQASPKHVLYTTFEEENLKSLLQTEESITVVPWKTSKLIPVSPGQRTTTKVSYCSSCGHVGEKTQFHSLPRKSKNGKDQNARKGTEIDSNSYPRPSKSTKDKNLGNNSKKQISKTVQFNEGTSNSFRQISGAENKNLQQESSPEETTNSSSNFSEKGRERPVKCRAVANTRPSLIRSFSDPTSSPRKDQKPRILYQHKRQVREATISQSNSLHRRIKARRHSVELQEVSESEISVWSQQRETRTARTTFSGSAADSDELHAKTMPKLKNGNIEDFYPLLKTKIPEEFIQEDGSVTLRSGEGVKKSDVDRDSGVDVDTNSGKTSFNQNASDRDLESEKDVTYTPDSVLDSSSNGDDSQEFDFDTLKKSDKHSMIESSEESFEDNGTLRRQSSFPREKNEETWDMYTLLRRFECVEWELSPASNLKRQTLDLDNCNLDSVPAAVAEIEYYAFRDVEAVSLNHNTKIENADVLGKLADLRVINMWGCNLKAIPQTWSRLTKLQMLGLGNNQQLTNFGPMKHLTNIVWLDLGGCGLKHIPDEVTNMMKLKVLALGGNPGIAIGDEICSLWDLKKLGLNDCELEEIPKPVFSLTKLTHLHVDNNYICHISQEIVQLTELEQLTVTGNSNIVFPKILSQCDTIKCIIVDETKDLSRVSGTLKNRMRQMSTAISPVREPAPPAPKPRLASVS